jgi:hypothetical protein
LLSSPLLEALMTAATEFKSLPTLPPALKRARDATRFVARRIENQTLAYLHANERARLGTVAALGYLSRAVADAYTDLRFELVLEPAQLYTLATTGTLTPGGRGLDAEGCVPFSGRVCHDTLALVPGSLVISRAFAETYGLFTARAPRSYRASETETAAHALSANTVTYKGLGWLYAALQLQAIPGAVSEPHMRLVRPSCPQATGFDTGAIEAVVLDRSRPESQFLGKLFARHGVAVHLA